MKSIVSRVLLTTSVLATCGVARADVNVVASIKPVHSLVAAVMEGVGEPGLIVDGAGSPHDYSMKPSDARELEQADVIFWIGEGMEAFLAKPIGTLGANAHVVALDRAHGLTTHAFREGGPFEAHEDGHDEGHASAAHDGHGHDHDESAEAEHAHEEHGHDGEHDAAHAGHEHGETDMHIWLDPLNAKAMVHEIAEALAEADPANAGQYAENAERLEMKLDGLVAEMEAELAPVRHRPFVVFHDAYQYIEKRFGLTTAGSITVSPEIMPGAERIREIRTKVRELDATCVFAEPQFEPKLIAVVTEGTEARSGVLDPLGAALDNGPELYFEMMREMAGSIRTCLSEAS